MDKNNTPKSNVTTIKINRETKARLEKLRSYRRESYDDILQKILEILNSVRTESERARAKLISIDKQNKEERKSS